MLRAWPAHGSWSTASSPAGGAVGRTWPGPPTTNQVRPLLWFPDLSFTAQREWCCGVMRNSWDPFPLDPPPQTSTVLQSETTWLTAETCQTYQTPPRCNGWLQQTNDCKQLVDCIHQWFHCTLNKDDTRAAPLSSTMSIPPSFSPVCVQGRTCPTAGTMRSNSTTSAVLASPPAPVRFSPHHLHTIPSKLWEVAYLKWNSHVCMWILKTILTFTHIFWDFPFICLIS